MKLRPVYTFSKCRRGEWGRGRNNLGLSGGAVREQDVSSFRIFLFRLLLWRFRLRGGLLDGSSSVRAHTEFIPVIAIVASEVCNLAEGLVCDWVFDRHGARRHGIS
jgi:hypothetical protein